MNQWYRYLVSQHCFALRKACHRASHVVKALLVEVVEGQVPNRSAHGLAVGGCSFRPLSYTAEKYMPEDDLDSLLDGRLERALTKGEEHLPWIAI
ncbi:hypothetical protein SBV1_30029 [Verrucomicrobia bacterium]|nr:hypothetical protein SBV1_30029 [Verrucomicrobiota bacterium]